LVTISSDIRAPVSWSPDGKALTYTTRSGATGARIVIKIARLTAGRIDENTITDGTRNEQRPTWSPDGTWIAFVRLAPNGQNGIWLVRPDG
jgi:Tol biopolymer transport system component